MTHPLFAEVMRRRAFGLGRELRLHLDPADTVLDVGSGTGHNAQALLELGACAAAFAVDVVDMRVVGPPVQRFDGLRLPFEDRSVDHVLLLYVLHYADEPAALLRECARVARRSVLVVQSTHEGIVGEAALRLNELLWGPVAWGLARVAGWIPPGRFSLGSRRFYDEARLLGIFTEAGLTVEGRAPRPWRLRRVRSDLWRLRGDWQEPPGP